MPNSRKPVIELRANAPKYNILDSVAHPIIYVRGYARNVGAQNETAADPFCGFNLGSTVYRATPDKKLPARKFIFESPLLRLAIDYGYSDVYEEGLDIREEGWNGTLPARSIVIHRYYDEFSSLLGKGKGGSPIEHFAKDLSDLILKVRELVCGNNPDKIDESNFRCYLVAHSMGGLICRAFLQNSKFGTDEARKCVDKLFTYATPHNGIEMAGLNVPHWASAFDFKNFNIGTMRNYLGLGKSKDDNCRADEIAESQFPSSRIFCMVGTNRADYEEAWGMSRAFSGHGSDGLVRIDNATLNGIDKQGKITNPCAAAYAYRSHSGYFGIVNSEEGYQNLTRFLFGNLRVDIWLDIKEVRLPKFPKELKGKPKALYLFELLTSPRGKRWYLSRRVAEEDSVACRPHSRIVEECRDGNVCSVYLSSIFLADYARVDQERKTLAYDLTLGVRVPDYQVGDRFWDERHYEGAYLYRDTAIIEITRPEDNEGKWKVMHGLQSKTPGRAPANLRVDAKGKAAEMKIEINSINDTSDDPGIKGHLRLVAQEWNVKDAKEADARR